MGFLCKMVIFGGRTFQQSTFRNLATENALKVSPPVPFLGMV